MRVLHLTWFTPPTKPRPAPPFFGQERALKALESAFHQGGHGYLVGPSGLGKRKRFLAYLEGKAFPKEELVYLPLGEEAFPLLLPEGEGRALVEGVEALLAEFTPSLFREKGFLYAKSLVEARYEKEAEALLQALAEEAKEKGFTLEAEEGGFTLSGQGPLPPELSARLEETILAYVDLRQKAQAQVAALRRGFAERFLLPKAEELKGRFPQAGHYLHWLLENLLRAAALEEALEAEKLLPRLLVEGGVRVVHEPNPTPERLFGHLEYEVREGALTTHLGLLRPGALHRATGGVLVLEAHRVLELGSYPLLKRALATGEVEPLAPRPEVRGPRLKPAPLKAQVFLVGPPEVMAFLEEDEEFLELFPFRVEFAPEIPYTEENVAYLGGFLEAEGVALTPEGLAALADEARRMAGHQGRLDARLFRLLDLAKEAEAYRKPLDREAVQRALRAREERFGLEEELYLQDLKEGVVALEVQGERVGEVNGLVVVEGPWPTGRPVRITAQAGPGREGILSIDREVGLGGQVFHKAVLTLAGYLRGTYAQVGALSATVSLVFEQSYGGIEGDSAGLAELLAVLSALSGLPLRQDLAVTGAIDQTGRVLAVGRVAEKVEGFFRICQALGPTGTQGVVLPKANLPHLTLREEVVGAVEKGTFHLYAVEAVDEAIELLFGRKAYWVHEKVRETLAHFQSLENGEEKG
ncbi:MULTISPECIES: AAA family ATPase [Thermus]|jgi:ATP-dependent Lon protease|uniref:endopeptidase La n=1 Tax=Thermus brockianus TaxID=56956 RepID=A0A1J0LU27_THEBO|nr:AAA family ATPase [Thermus brockianus]APD09179.1 ATP-dependent protease La [Thermus brockianus]